MATRGFKIADAFVSVTLDRDSLRQDIEDLPAHLDSDVDAAGRSMGGRLGKGVSDGADGQNVGRKVVRDVAAGAAPDADKAGRDTGDKVSKGMQKGISQSSPLIVAAIAGGLIAGAPAVLSAAGVLFAGLAAVAVHSNAQVQAAFGATKDAVTSTFSQAAQVTVPFFVNALGRISTAVQGMGPQFHDAFASLGAPIDSLTTGLIQMAQNALPGIVTAVKAAGPVFQGLASLLASIGTGLGQFFGIIAQHSGAAGQVFAQLGQIIGALLPILGQLVGAGAELASRVLPPVVAILHGVASALGAVSPMLAPVLAGFLAFKAIGFLGGMLQTLSAKLQTVAADGGRLTTTLAGGGASAVSKFAGALPAIGIALAALSFAFEAESQKIDDWGKALLDGGNAAAQAQAKMANPSFWDKFTYNLTHWFNTQKVATAEMQHATAASQEMYAAMSPLQQKQQDVTTATNDLQKAVHDYGADSGQAAGASVNLKEKQDALTQAQAELDQATHGVTQAILDEADAAIASADSGLAYRRAEQQSTQAAKDFEAAVRSHKSALNDNSDASLNYEQALLRQAEAAGKAAADASGLTDKMDLQKVSDQAVLKELLNLKAEYGVNFPASLQATIDRLQKSGVALDDVGAKQPTPTVDLNQVPFQNVLSGIQNSMSWLTGSRPTPIANLNANPYSQVANGLFSSLMSINFARPTPVASMNAGPFGSIANWVSGTMGWLGGLQAFPYVTALASTWQAENAINFVARPRTAMVYTIYSGSGFTGPAATGGLVGEVVGRRFAQGGSFFSGQVFGPGGPMDDLVQAINEHGMPLRVSNREWVINGAVSDKQGPRKMAALNAGQADITVRNPGFADGGSPSGSSGGGGGMTIEHLDVHLEGTFDFTDPAAMRRAAAAFEQYLIQLYRERN